MKMPIVVLRGGDVDGAMRGWDGPWPPPETLISLRGPITGDYRITELTPDRLDAIHRAEELDFVVHVYQRISYSKLEEDLDGVVRGAEYRFNRVWSERT